MVVNLFARLGEAIRQATHDTSKQLAKEAGLSAPRKHELARPDAFFYAARKTTDFDKSLKEILRHEGGYVNHPRDPGGMTNLGVTRRVWEKWKGSAASEAEMRALTPEVVAPLYKAWYWDKCQCDRLPTGLNLCVFDFAVNAGPARAARYLQGMVGAEQDGVIGPMTLRDTAAYAGAHGEDTAVNEYQDRRVGYYKRLRTFKTFGRGWLRRVEAVRKAALAML